MVFQVTPLKVTPLKVPPHKVTPPMGQPPIASSSWAKNPRPDENPKPSAHHEKPYSA